MEKIYKGGTSKRYCLSCEKITTFRYNKNILHSMCLECGNSFGVNPKNKVLQHFLNYLNEICYDKDLDKQYKILKLENNKLKNQVKSLKGDIKRLSKELKEEKKNG